MLSEIKQFDIESEAINASGFKNRATNFEAKRLEPALSIPERQTGRQTHQQVEGAAGLLASPRLVNANQSSIQRPGPTSHVNFTSCNRLDQFRGLFKRSGKIGVRKETDRFSRREQSGSNGRPFTAIWKILQQTRLNPGVF